LSGRILHVVVFGVLSLVGPRIWAQTPSVSSSPGLQTAIRDVNFENSTVLSTQEQEEIAQKLQWQDPFWLGRQTPEAMEQLVDQTVLDCYRDHGYWRAKVTAQVHWVNASEAHRQVDVAIRTISEGRQYVLTELHWSGTQVFREETLAGLMPLRPHEVLSEGKLRQGLEAIRRLYNANGYLAFTAQPQMEFDDAAAGVALNIAVQEDTLFSFRSLSVEGFDPATSEQLRRRWENLKEQPYSAEKLRVFLGQFFPRSGPDPLEYSTSNIDLNSHTVDVVVSIETQARKSAR